MDTRHRRVVAESNGGVWVVREHMCRARGRLVIAVGEALGTAGLHCVRSNNHEGLFIELPSTSEIQIRVGLLCHCG